MTRAMSAAMSTEMQAAANRPVLFVDLDFPSGAVRLSTHDRDLTVDGNVFSGDGDLISIGAIEETIEVRAAGVPVTLSGAVAALISTLFDDDYQGRPARLWLGMLDGAGALVADPIEMGPYRMDACAFVDDPERPRAVIHLESRLRDLAAPRERRWSNEDQKASFAGDTGFRYVEALADASQRFGGS